MVAVTGTNGKTGGQFRADDLGRAGPRGNQPGHDRGEGAWSAPLAHTTPEPITLHRTLAAAEAVGITHAAMEASSHGLAQRRLDGVHLMAAGFTNFTQDHLDYHDSFDAYFEAKAGLVFAGAARGWHGGDQYRRSARARHGRHCRRPGQAVMAVGRTEGADIQLTAQRFDATGQEVFFTHKSTGYRLLPAVDWRVPGGKRACWPRGW